MTPKIILICEGGVIQQIIANTEVEIVNLDYDIFDGGDYPDEGDDHYEQRHFGHQVDVHKGEAFDEIEAECRDEWEKEYEKAFGARD